MVASSSAGDNETMVPTSSVVFAHPSSRWPIPASNESSTVEWQSAQVMPTLVTCPASFTVPLRPTTAFSRNRVAVTLGSSRFTSPARSAAISSGGSASTSTLRPTFSAVAGETVAIASCMRKTPVHSCSSPKVS